MFNLANLDHIQISHQITDSVCLLCYISNGHLMAFSLPSLRLLLDVDFLPLADLRWDINWILFLASTFPSSVWFLTWKFFASAVHCKMTQDEENMKKKLSTSNIDTESEIYCIKEKKENKLFFIPWINPNSSWVFMANTQKFVVYNYKWN